MLAHKPRQTGEAPDALAAEANVRMIGDILKPILVVISVVFLYCNVSFAGSYWPTETQSTYLYMNESGDVLEVAYGNSGDRVSRFLGPQVARVTERYYEDEAGNVFLSFSELYFEGAIDPEYSYGFVDAHKFVDLPLNTGKTWTSCTTASG